MNEYKNSKITYFFQEGRLKKIKSKTPYAKEMFYGYHYFKKNYENVEIVEFENNINFFERQFFKLEKKLRNAFKLPIYWSYITNRKNYKIIKESDFIVSGNNRVGSAVLPMLFLSKIFNNKISSLCFVMGLFSRKPRYKFLEYFQKKYLLLMLSVHDNFIFLSEKEMEYGKINFPSKSKKFHFLPFTVDQEMWKHNLSDDNKNKIIFVGNDGNREYRFVEDIVNNLVNQDFTIVSSLIEENNLKSENYKIYSGTWGDPKVTDQELNKLYRDAKLTIIPLVNTLQPSGQSVALQSLSSGTPVLITHTEGFWDNKNFINEENIFFLKENDLDEWINKINLIFAMNDVEYKKIVKNGIELINNHYGLENFSTKVEEILFNKDVN
tara:strand:+ start:1711 stop:2853 length:1143 start_codon:yes stop_codon:yes gene_type:complete